MAEGGHEGSWWCSRQIDKMCPPEGCPVAYGCAREHGWDSGQPSPREVLGLSANPQETPNASEGEPAQSWQSGYETGWNDHEELVRRRASPPPPAGEVGELVAEWQDFRRPRTRNIADTAMALSLGFGLGDRLAAALTAAHARLTESEANAYDWHRTCQVIATIMGLPEPGPCFAQAVRDELDRRDHVAHARLTSAAGRVRERATIIENAYSRIEAEHVRAIADYLDRKDDPS